MAISLEQAKNLRYGSELWTISDNPRKRNKICRLKVNGAPKIWKTRPAAVQIPWKYGMYEFGYMGTTPMCNVKLEDLFSSEAECRAEFERQLELDGGIK